MNVKRREKQREKRKRKVWLWEKKWNVWNFLLIGSKLRVIRFYYDGPRYGDWEVFTENLPG